MSALKGVYVSLLRFYSYVMLMWLVAACLLSFYMPAAFIRVLKTL
ncbi:hypothetical protein PCIT_a3859 [Pseudoalteromonas citrea]|uniref:Uncharacterized protein n=1 Tax=Pseudoalteromonas citrea TaxID=43655 RepID=A0AAD4AGC9_9GAMM|nr:hypothetical protein PCIT_a3859 [Pseudoalteromonas citrea]